MTWSDIVNKTAHIKIDQPKSTYSSNKSTNNKSTISDNSKEDELDRLPSGKFKITSKHAHTILNLRTSLKLKQLDIDHMFSLPKNTCNSLEKANTIIDEKLYNKVLQGLNNKITK